MKVLITGAGGSGGSYLAEYIVAHEPRAKLHALARRDSELTCRNLAQIRDKAQIHFCDLNDFAKTSALIKTVHPDVIFHLASDANVRRSFDEPRATITNNVMSTLNLFEAVRVARLDPVIQLCSTSEVYGQIRPDEVPIKETAPLRPVSPYAASKTSQDLLGLVYFKSYGMKIIRTRMFTYFNPRRADLFATAFALQVARIERGTKAELLHGNLDSSRTFIDVRDAMEAYWVAARSCEPGEAYNIGGTTTKTVGEVLELLKARATCPISSRVNPDLLRPADVTLQIPDVTKFTRATGWAPRFSFDESIAHLLDECRRQVAAEAS